ncbi:hypothetical protein OS493_011174, partial [Desmophyllum pertusum]
VQHIWNNGFVCAKYRRFTEDPATTLAETFSVDWFLLNPDLSLGFAPCCFLGNQWKTITHPKTNRTELVD